MPDALKAEIDLGYTDGSVTAKNYFLTCKSYLHKAAAFILANNWPGAQSSLDNAADALGAASSYLLQPATYASSFARHWKNALYWINNNWPAAVTVDMDAILNAMLVASFEQLQSFIGIEDAYRVALWNAPFNADFYAALARGFQKWPNG